MTGERSERDATIDEIRKVWLESLGIELREHEWKGIDRLHQLAGLDSVAVLELVVALEQRFGMTIEPEWLKIDRLTDLPALADYIRQRSAAQARPGPDGA